MSLAIEAATDWRGAKLRLATVTYRISNLFNHFLAGLVVFVIGCYAASAFAVLIFSVFQYQIIDVMNLVITGLFPEASPIQGALVKLNIGTPPALNGHILAAVIYVGLVTAIGFVVGIRQGALVRNVVIAVGIGLPLFIGAQYGTLIGNIIISIGYVALVVFLYGFVIPFGRAFNYAVLLRERTPVLTDAQIDQRYYVEFLDQSQLNPFLNGDADIAPTTEQLNQLKTTTTVRAGTGELNEATNKPEKEEI